MLSEREVRESNRTYWQKHGAVCFEDYVHYASKHADPTDKAKSGCLISYAQSHAHYAFHLLADGHDQAGQEAAQNVIRFSQEALATRNFDAIYTEEVRDKSPYTEIERAAGFARALKWLHYGVWFKSGKRPLEILTQAAQHNRQYHDLLPLKSERRSVVGSVLMDMVAAEAYRPCLDLFRREFADDANLSDSSNLTRSTERTVGALCDFALGRTELRDVALAGVEAWYNRSSSWYPIDARLSWHTRLGWTYLRSKHTKETTDLRLILEQLRRC